MVTCLTGAQPAEHHADEPAGWFRQPERSAGRGGRDVGQPTRAAAARPGRLPGAQGQVRQGGHGACRGVRRDAVLSSLLLTSRSVYHRQGRLQVYKVKWTVGLVKWEGVGCRERCLFSTSGEVWGESCVSSQKKRNFQFFFWNVVFWCNVVAICQHVNFVISVGKRKVSGLMYPPTVNFLDLHRSLKNCR